jgi:hypothetical protein
VSGNFKPVNKLQSLPKASKCFLSEIFMNSSSDTRIVSSQDSRHPDDAAVARLSPQKNCSATSLNSRICQPPVEENENLNGAFQQLAGITEIEDMCV